MTYTERFSEGNAVLADINPASYTSEQNTGAVSFANYARGVVLIHAGVLGQDVDIDVEQSTTAAGTPKAFDSNAKDIPLTATTDNNTISVIEINADEFGVANGYYFLNVECPPAGPSSIFSVLVLGTVPRFKPVPTTTLDSVTD